MKFKKVSLPMADPKSFNDLPVVPDMEINIPEWIFEDLDEGSSSSSSRTVSSVISPKPQSKNKAGAK